MPLFRRSHGVAETLSIAFAGPSAVHIRHFYTRIHLIAITASLRHLPAAAILVPSRGPSAFRTPLKSCSSLYIF